MNIVVVGLGKIGLPLAAQYALKDHQVVGIDVNADTVATVNAAKEPFPGEHGLADALSDVVSSGRLSATTSYADAVPNADVVIVVVPLFVDDSGSPDFDWMDSATHDLGHNLSRDTLVVYETTLPVGTTRSRWKPMLEELSGLTEGEDFHLVFSPERVLTGRVFADLRKYPKLVGALSDAGARRAVDFYSAVLDFDERADLDKENGVWDLGSAEAAEMTKLAETTYRDVNIGLANQFARFAEVAGVDVFQVIDAANSQPFSHIHKPGIAVGGHCIPVYPQLYLSSDPAATVVIAARAANVAMPAHAVDLLASHLSDLSQVSVVVLGAAYRGGVKETAFSGVFPLVNQLLSRGALVSVHDPMYTDVELEALGLIPHTLGTVVSAAILHTDHESYRRLTEDDLPGLRVLVDGRNMMEKLGAATILTIGKAATIPALPNSL